MNLYRLFYVNKHNPRFIHREKLLERLNNAKEFTLEDVNAVRAYRGMKPIQELRTFDIRTFTKKAFESSFSEDKFSELGRIKGVGVVLASEILSFQSPRKYAAISHNVWNILVRDFGFYAKEKKSDDDFSVREYEKYLYKITALADEYGMKPADAEFVLNYLYGKE